MSADVPTAESGIKADGTTPTSQALDIGKELREVVAATIKEIAKTNADRPPSKTDSAKSLRAYEDLRKNLLEECDRMRARVNRKPPDGDGADERHIKEQRKAARRLAKALDALANVEHLRREQINDLAKSRLPPPGST